MVEGHTDDVPITGNQKYLKDNWDLSVLRATSIVNILTENGVMADRILAAGKGEYAPVASNDSEEGRGKNRRTEIILTPKLDELLQVLESN
jgi:chemotaxis protein MotB